MRATRRPGGAAPDTAVRRTLLDLALPTFTGTLYPTLVQDREARAKGRAWRGQTPRHGAGTGGVRSLQGQVRTGVGIGGERIAGCRHGAPHAPRQRGQSRPLAPPPHHPHRSWRRTNGHDGSDEGLPRRRQRISTLTADALTATTCNRHHRGHKRSRSIESHQGTALPVQYHALRCAKGDSHVCVCAEQRAGIGGHIP